MGNFMTQLCINNINKKIHGAWFGCLALMLAVSGVGCGGGGSVGSGGAGGAGGSASMCRTAADCAGQDTECQARTCAMGACGVSNMPAGTVVASQIATDCKRNECDGNGAIVSVNDD